jgi:death-on-curing protein
MRLLLLSEVLHLHRLVVTSSGGSDGVRDLGALESAVAQPHASFDGSELYPSLVEKGAALAFSIVRNHPFLDGNKRVGHAALETFLLLNGFELVASVPEQEQVFLSLASGSLSREEFVTWLEGHACQSSGPA